MRSRIILSVGAFLMAGTTTGHAQFSGGDGSATNPFQVATAEHVDAVRNHLGAHFRQITTIDISGFTNWVPIGVYSASPFHGVYDGGRFALQGLTIDRSGASYQGLFGFMTNAIVRNLRLEGVSVTGASYVGALVGTAWRSTMEWVRVEGDIQAAGSFSGGLMGQTDRTMIHACSADVTVTGVDYTGGLIGYLYQQSELRHSHTTGSVSGNNSVGGLVGVAYFQNEVISDCYSHAAVSGSQRVGGLVGLSLYVFRSFSTGPVTGSTTNEIGGLVGRNFGLVRDSYWDTESSGQASSDGGTGLTTALMRQQASYRHFNFDSLWTIEEGVAYPEFRDIETYEQLRAVTPDELAGAGTIENPYVVTNVHELSAMRLAPTNHYRLGADIDMTPVVAWDLGRGWTGIGVSSPSTNQFTGSLDGAGYTVSNLTINRPRFGQYEGLFGYMNAYGRVQDLRLAGVSVQAWSWSGGLVGYANWSELDNIHVEGCVVGSDRWLGGVAGTLNYSTASRLTMSGSVVGGRQVGGVAGHLSRSTLRHASCAGAVVGTTNDVGGLVGHAYGVESMVLDSYNLASVNGRNEVGGLVGKLEQASILRAYSAGLVTGSSSTNIGGLVGTNAAGRVQEAYWDTEAAGQADSAGGTGLSTEQMREKATYRYFHFGPLWTIEEGVDYPVFAELTAYERPRNLVLADLPGSGTAVEPYIITNVHGLNAMRLGRTNYYRLGADIDATDTVAWDLGRGWTPVGTSVATNRFAGHLDGAGFSIINLAVNRPTNTYQGLFGYFNNGSVSDLVLSNVNVQAARYSGCLAGASVNAMWNGIQVSGAVLAHGDDVGGVAGGSGSDLGYRINASVDVKGNNRVGGISGSMNAQFIQVRSEGSVAGITNVGGVAGFFSAASAEILDGYSRCDVSGMAQVGGLVGFVSGGEVIRAYSAGAVSASTTNFVGGLVGRNAGLIRDAYWDTNTSGQAESAGGAGYSTAGMYQQATYAGFNFTDVWSIDEGVDYPVFQGTRIYQLPQPLTLDDLAGSGTADDPYIVNDIHELNTMRLGLTNHYRLGSSIDLSDTAIWDMGRGWTPVGSSSGSASFRGTVDGGGHTLYNLRINRPSGFTQGLFGYAQNATFRRINLAGLDIQSLGNVGGLAGIAENCAFETIAVDGRIYGIGQNFLGGMAGMMSGGLAHRIRANVDLQGANFVGGIAGNFGNAELRHSSAIGTIAGATNVGGVAGSQGKALITDCYSLAAVHGRGRVGGLVGSVSVTSMLYRSYSAGTVTATTTNAVGGLIGLISDSKVRSAYWDTETSGQDHSAAGVGLNTAAMRQQNSYLYFNFNSLWMIDEEVDYPAFRDLAAYDAPMNLTLADLPGSGTESDPYLIGDAHQLHAVRLGLTNYYRLANDIDLSNCVIWDMGRGWTPIGAASPEAAAFRGHLDGAGYAIRFLPISSPNRFYLGLFGYMENGSVRNLRLVDPNLQVSTYAGAIAGMAKNCQFEKLSARDAVVLGEWGVVGGLIGQLWAGRLHNSEASATVMASRETGGLIGYMYDSPQVYNAHAEGRVVGGTRMGGLVGSMYWGTPRISNSFSRVSVEGEDRTGGLVGHLFNGTVSRCYSTGPVSALTTNHIGGLVGFNTGSVGDSYWDVTTSGQTHSAGGIGRTTGEMTYPYDPDTYVGWDFSSTWKNDTDGRNAGYPYLIGRYPDDYILIYLANVGGAISGTTPQYVRPGWDGATVTAMPEDGAEFDAWSDGRIDNPRTDTDVQSHLTVTASFRSAAGVPISWYDDYGIAPEGGETWSDVDQRYNLIKDMTLKEEYIADTDPGDNASRFVVEEMRLEPGVAAHFQSSSNRLYTLHGIAELTGGNWTNVPGAGPRLGVGGADLVADTNEPPYGPYYRLNVALP